MTTLLKLEMFNFIKSTLGTSPDFTLDVFTAMTESNTIFNNGESSIIGSSPLTYFRERD